MPTYNISLNKELADIVDVELKRGKYSNRSEFFRQLLRKVFVVEVDENGFTKEERIELEKRIDSFDGGKEELIPLEEIEKEFNL